MKLIYVELDREAIASRLSKLEYENIHESDWENDWAEDDWAENNNLFDESDESKNLNASVEDSENPAEGLEAEELDEESTVAKFLQSFAPEISLPYILRTDDVESDELDWNGIVDGILYIALYEPKHEHIHYYKDFLLSLEPELPYILHDRLRSQYEQRLWTYARDTVNLLLFLLPTETWPLLELCYLYEQEAEEALMEQRFADCRNSWNHAALAYKQLLEREDINAKCYFQLGHYYLQCWDYPAAYRAFVSCQQLALVPEHPLWGQSHNWLQKIALFDMPEDSESLKVLSLRWAQLMEGFVQSMVAGQDKAGEQVAEGFALAKQLWLVPLEILNELLRENPSSPCLWYLRGFCLLYGHDVATLCSLSEAFGESKGASQAFAKAQELGWSGPLEWQQSYYLGVSYYLEGSYREAERCLLKILERHTEHTATLYWLEKIYSDLEDWRSQQYQALLQALNPAFPDLIQMFI